MVPPAATRRGEGRTLAGSRPGSVKGGDACTPMNKMEKEKMVVV